MADDQRPCDSQPAGGRQPAQDRLRELMREYQSGCFEAFDEIYASLAPAVRRYLLSQARDAAKADDLVQETFLQMHRARHTYDSSLPLMPWAMAIARHVWLMDRRTLSRHHPASRVGIQFQGNRRAGRHRRNLGEAALELGHGAVARRAERAADGAAARTSCLPTWPPSSCPR